MAMVSNLERLTRGQEIWGIVEEVLAAQELLINFSGELARVANSSRFRFHVGQRVLLRVTTARPLELKLIYPAARTTARSDLDLSV